VPPWIKRPPYADGKPSNSGGVSVPLDDATIAKMRKACRAAAEVLAEVGARVAPGVTTDQIDVWTHEAYLARGGYPSTLGYPSSTGADPYPKSLCTSVNEVVLHGIPDDRALEEGDIVNLDITIYLDGVHGDCSATFGVGNVDDASARLMRVTRECLMLGVQAVKPGRPVSDIGMAIDPHAKKHGYGVIREYGGHGIDRRFHTDFHVPHYAGSRADDLMLPGMVFTIEPMLTSGKPRLTRWPDGWTEVASDGKRSAQFEHTILVTAHGAEILTGGDGIK
jgi:methionyl aminopeptidase